VRARDLPDDRTPDTAAVLAAAGPGWVDLAGLARKSGRSRATVQQALALLIARELVLTHAGVVTVGRLGGDPRPMTLYRDARLGAFGTILLTNETGKGADDADAA
jgi:hypothetical protein